MSEYPTWLFDVEIYRNFSLIGLRDRATGATLQFSNTAGIGGTLDEARAWFRREEAGALFVGFNSRGYDNVILRAILVEEVDDPNKLYQLSQRVIGSRRVYQERIDREVSVDLLAVHGGQNARIGSLKEVGCKLDAPRLQELPYPFDAELTLDQQREVAKYNLVDLAVTAQVEAVSHEQINMRVALAVTYQCPAVLNQHDAGVADKIMAQQLFGHARPMFPQATSWHLQGQALTQKFRFRHPDLEALRQRISAWSLAYELVTTVGIDAEIEKEIAGSGYAEAVRVDGTSYRIGSGGLHSVDEPAIYEADERFRLIDFDVNSFYPALTINHRLAPTHVPVEQFIAAFSRLRDHRLAAKANKEKALTGGLKIALNSIFGKTKSPYSWLCDPTMQVSITIFGQLTLLTFVDMLAGIDGIEVVSANTDGLMLRLRRDLAEEVIAAMHAQAAAMNLTLDQVEYVKLARRDVNNYVAVAHDGSLKTKGAYGYDRSELGKKPVNRIVTRAAQQYFLAGTPVADTIRACTDIRDFVDFFKCNKGYTIVDDLGGQHGSIVRWYVSTGGVHLDKVKLADGKLFQLVERGAQLIADLPAAFPDDVDYAAYIAMAEKLVTDITEPELRVTTSVPLAELSAAQRVKHQHNQDTTEPDTAVCQAFDLTRYHLDYANNVRGNRYDTMKTLLVRAWLSAQGALSCADLLWVSRELDAADGYFTGARKRTLTKMVAWIGREISPFPLPKSSAEQISRALGWAQEHVERAKVKRKMWHRGAQDSRYISGEALRKYAKDRNEYKLACSICAASVKHDATQDPRVLLTILEDAIQYVGNPACRQSHPERVATVAAGAFEPRAKYNDGL